MCDIHRNVRKRIKNNFYTHQTQLKLYTDESASKPTAQNGAMAKRPQLFTLQRPHGVHNFKFHHNSTRIHSTSSKRGPEISLMFESNNFKNFLSLVGLPADPNPQIKTVFTEHPHLPVCFLKF